MDEKLQSKGGCAKYVGFLFLGLVAIFIYATISGSKEIAKLERESASNSTAAGTCPQDAKSRLNVAMSSGMYSVSADASGASIYISNRTADALGPLGLEALALITDCALSGSDDMHLSGLTIRPAPGGPIIAKYGAVELMEIRRKYEAGSIAVSGKY